MGRGLATPQMPSLEEASWVGPLLRAAFDAGVATGDLQPPVSDVDAFYRGVLLGMREAGLEVRSAHAQQAMCDPEDAGGMCRYCEDYQRSISLSRQDQQRWRAETQDAARGFAVLRSSKIHTRDCPSVLREVDLAEQRLSTLTPADARHGGEVISWPTLVTQEEAAALNRHRCRTCAPGVPERTPRRPGVTGAVTVEVET